MDSENFWKGISLVLSGLAEATKQASYSVGFGAGGLGAALVVLERLSIDGVKSTIISMSAFFIAARIGKGVDDLVEHISVMAKLKRDRKIELMKNSNRNNTYMPDTYMLEHLLNKYRCAAKDKSGTNYENVLIEIERELADLIAKLKNNKNL